ncbi:hypothetical protein BDZ45DRAFT_30988 [Acephala macrosclerotiorum]|nr:hypothetical protein BDZ45DRAFT_30988 [Acephala macrosclerotiorum]
MTKLPSELHREVFDLLGPASQRLLGATCSSLYRMYKEHYYEKDIVVSFGNDNLIGASGTTQYRDILAQWLIPTSFNVSRWDRCYYYGQLWNKMYANCSKKAKYNGTPYLYMEEERVKSGKGFLKF